MPQREGGWAQICPNVWEKTDSMSADDEMIAMNASPG